MAAHQPTRPSLRQQFSHEYNCWKSMRNRCANPDNASWKYYGARGIRVCESWQNSFTTFLEDIGPAPSPAHQIDRLHNDRNYEPGNCHWSTPAEQAMNTVKVRFLEFRGVRLPIQDWCKIFGHKYTTVTQRLDRNGWSVEEALTTPSMIQFRPKTRRRRPARQHTTDEFVWHSPPESP